MRYKRIKYYLQCSDCYEQVPLKKAEYNCSMSTSMDEDDYIASCHKCSSVFFIVGYDNKRGRF